MIARKPTKYESLRRLREIGTPINAVIDVGVQISTGELCAVFNDRPQLLIEPIHEWNGSIEKRHSSAGVDYELVNVAAGADDTEMNMRVSTLRDNQAITHARLTTETNGKNLRKVSVRTVDGLIKERTLKPPFLLKIDVDGAELDVLAGARNTLTDCSVVVIEAQVRNIHERMSKVVEFGFELFDVVDICYYDRRLAQVDLVFLNRQIVEDYRLNMFLDGFDIDKWMNYSA